MTFESWKSDFLSRAAAYGVSPAILTEVSPYLITAQKSAQAGGQNLLDEAQFQALLNDLGPEIAGKLLGRFAEEASATIPRVRSRNSRVTFRQRCGYEAGCPACRAAMASRPWANPTRKPSPVIAST